VLHLVQILYLVAFAALMPQRVGNFHHLRTVLVVILTAALSTQLLRQTGGAPCILVSPAFESLGFMGDNIDERLLANDSVVDLDNRQENSPTFSSRLPGVERTAAAETARTVPGSIEEAS
jgi:hypothetical protein